ncbi:hypothetical protein AX16_004589 [Volvariella volvacea WC 439]|nr:hypothetical protein AX16_004589 [Volvariella volvacea WC 439]
MSDPEPTSAPSTSSPTHDPTYYKSDGDCILLVSSVLFKIHRFLLTQDASTFGAMFSLPQSSDSPTQGSSDDNPITLPDDLEDFRALCWVLYALPEEISTQHDVKSVDISKLASLARICRKYEFSSIEQWSIKLLKTHLNAGSACQYPANCSENDLASILELSVLGGVKELEEFIVGKWVDRIRNEQLDVAHALNVAERLNLQKFQGSLYYIQFARISWPHMEASASDYPDIPHVRKELTRLLLTPDQRIKLASGSWALNLLWLSLLRKMASAPNHPTITISYPYSNGRTYPASCVTQSWVPVFNNLLLICNTDYLNSIDKMLKTLDENQSCQAEFQKLCLSCQSQARRKFTDAKTKLEGCLVNCFLGGIQD